MTQTISLQDLTPEQRQQLLQEAKNEEKTAKEKRANDLKALDELATESVPASMQKLIEASKILEQAKGEVFNNFMELLKMKANTIGIKTNQQSHTITAGKQSIKLGYRVTDGYGDNAAYGIAMIHKFLESLGSDAATKKIMNVVFRLLQRNGNGDLDSKKVIQLKQIADRDFPDTDFSRGVEIIQEEYKPKLSRWFIEAYQTDGTGIERNIPLSITSVDLPKDIDLTFLLPTD
ncbi:DUF3164 family protein [Chryseobacterium sp.]|uniref:DUF3164 family protein n=1 Tax=Chryseobacterium sp. TaxID=1871047 RepID=UPI002896E65E|nr:DUF3164 family protein [Chryseobacterium sp.]